MDRWRSATAPHDGCPPAPVGAVGRRARRPYVHRVARCRRATSSPIQPAPIRRAGTGGDHLLEPVGLVSSRSMRTGEPSAPGRPGARRAAGGDRAAGRTSARCRRRAPPVLARIEPHARVDNRRSTACSVYQPSSWTKTLDRSAFPRSTPLDSGGRSYGALGLGADEHDVAVEALRRAASRPPWPRPGRRRPRRTCSRALRPLRVATSRRSPHFMLRPGACQLRRGCAAHRARSGAEASLAIRRRAASSLGEREPSASPMPPSSPATARRAGIAGTARSPSSSAVPWREGRHRAGGEHGVGGPGRERQRRVEHERGAPRGRPGRRAGRRRSRALVLELRPRNAEGP